MGGTMQPLDGAEARFLFGQKVGPVGEEFNPTRRYHVVYDSRRNVFIEIPHGDTQAVVTALLQAERQSQADLNARRDGGHRCPWDPQE